MPKVKAKRRKRSFVQSGKLDITFLSLVLILFTVGLVMLFSASFAYSLAYYNNSYKFILRQGMWGAVGIVIMFIFSRIDYRIWRRFAWPIFAVSTLMLVFLLIAPPMVEGMNVKRWIVIGPLNFQPSEIAKFSVIVLFSALIAANQKSIKTFKFIAFMAFLLGVTCMLVMFEPHISATALIGMIGVTLLIVGGMQLRYIFGTAGIAAAAGIMLLFTDVVSYVKVKFNYWLDPWSDPTGKGFQPIQSLLAIGSGGIMGRGIGQSRQKYLYLPEPHNDFIFAIVCEELGLIGAMVIIGLFALLVWRGFTIAMRSPDRFGSLLAVGLTFQVGVQAMFNIFVVTNTIPNTGISLPFFSYGGTSLIILLAEMGIVLSVSRGANLEKG